MWWIGCVELGCVVKALCTIALCKKTECSNEDVDARMCANEMWATGVCSNKTNRNL